MPLKFKDVDSEKYLLSSFLKGPEFWKDIPNEWFSELLHQKTYMEFKKILKPPYSSFPTANIIIDKAEDPDVKLLVSEVSFLEINSSEVNVKLHDLFDMYCARKVFDIAQRLPEQLEKEKVSDIIRNNITAFSGLLNPLSIGEVSREFIFDSARERWLYYKEVEAGNIQDTAIPLHISEFDRLTKGGLRKSHILCLVAGTGDFKSLTMESIAYSTAFLEKKDTMVLTLEIPGSGDQKDYQRMIDARHSLLEFGDIVSGTLNVYKSTYREKLKDIEDQKYPLYIVDIPDKATSADVIKELELYYAKRGKYPEVVIIDYINEMEPVSGYNNTSEKFKQLGIELRRITRSYGVRLITAMQLNREGKKIKEGEKRDLEHMSESHYFSNVCHVVIFLHQDSNGIDAATNQLHWTVRKNRYGQKNVTFTTFANAPFCYVGDKKVIYAGFEQ